MNIYFIVLLFTFVLLIPVLSQVPTGLPGGHFHYIIL